MTMHWEVSCAVVSLILWTRPRKNTRMCYGLGAGTTNLYHCPATARKSWIIIAGQQLLLLSDWLPRHHCVIILWRFTPPATGQETPGEIMTPAENYLGVISYCYFSGDPVGVSLCPVQFNEDQFSLAVCCSRERVFSKDTASDKDDLHNSTGQDRPPGICTEQETRRQSLLRIWTIIMASD